MRSISADRVAHRVERLAPGAIDLPRLAEVQAAGQLADDQQVGTPRDLRLERRRRLRSRARCAPAAGWRRHPGPCAAPAARLPAAPSTAGDRTPDRRPRPAASPCAAWHAASVVGRQRGEPRAQRGAAHRIRLVVDRVAEASARRRRARRRAAATTSGPMPSPGSRAMCRCMSRVIGSSGRTCGDLGPALGRSACRPA